MTKKGEQAVVQMDKAEIQVRATTLNTSNTFSSLLQSHNVLKFFGDRFGHIVGRQLENLPPVADPSLFLESQFIECGTGCWEGLKCGRSTTDCIGK